MCGIFCFNMFGLYFKRLMIFQLVSFADTFYGEIEFPPKKKNLIESGNTTTRLADKEGEKERKTSLSKKQNKKTKQQKQI